MARVAWTARLQPDRIRDYERAHAAVRPEVLALIKGAGVHDYSIFRFEDRVFGVYECEDPVAAQALMDVGETELGWRAEMAELFQPEVSERGADPMVEIFRLD
jgi:L-rhamnose mutarotase